MMKFSALAILLAIPACADRDATLATTTAPLTVISEDCDVDAGYQLDAYAPGGGTLQIVGVYEARNSDAPWWADPECSACLDNPSCAQDQAAYGAACDPSPTIHPGSVHVAATTTTLVLTSYEPTAWTVTADPGAALARVILSSYAESTVLVPPGVTVETADLGYAYRWITDADAAGCEAEYGPAYCEQFGDHYADELAEAVAGQEALVAAAEQLSGDTLGSFHGCYSMSTIAFGDPTR